MKELRDALMISLSIALMLFGLSEYAKAVTDEYKHVNSDCIGVHYGDGSTSSCAASDGAAGAYDTCSRWESQNANLVSADKRQVVYFSGSAADTTSCAFAGWTVDATRYPLLTCTGANCHSGIWSTSKYRLSVSSGSPALVIGNYLRVVGLQIERSGGGGTSPTIDIADFYTGVWITNNLIRGLTGCSLASPGNCIGINFSYVTGGRIVNNIISGVTRGIYLRPSGSVEQLVANNTIVGIDSVGIYAFRYESGSYTLTLKNNYIADPADYSSYVFDGTNGTLTTSNNASGDTSSPEASYRSVSPTFVGGSDYHLASGDTALKDNGADLSGSFTDDIDFQTRSGSWDIGADEYQASGASLLLLKYASEN